VLKNFFKAKSVTLSPHFLVVVGAVLSFKIGSGGKALNLDFVQ
jgi:hypothetical protein